MKRDSFIIYRSFYGLIKLLKEKEQLKMYKAIFDYGFDGTETKFTDDTSMAIWEAIKPQLRANNARYENGLKGGAPIGNSNARKNNLNQPNETTEKQPNNEDENNLTDKNFSTEKQPNENVNENENVNVIESKKESKDIFKKITTGARESYDEIMDKLEVTGIVRDKIWEFIQHCNLNGKIMTNAKLEDILIRLDMKYRSDEQAKISAILEAISKGYYDVR